MRTIDLSAATPARNRKLPVWSPLLLALGCLGGLAQAQGTPPAGTVLFVSGPGFLVGADGTRTPLLAGTQVHQGEQVATGADGYAHVRMIDNAFVAVRPDSRLAVELYEYDAANPAASRIKLQLFSGNARTVSGKGGQAAKHNYRFNTPMAAIGLRGTDYTVSTTDSATRVSVTAGAVAVTPLGEGCSAAALGPCATGSTRELNAGLSHAYMEVNARQSVPVLVRPEQDPQGGKGQNPSARPEEPRAETRGSLKLAGSKDAANEVNAELLTLGLAGVPDPLPPAAPAPAPAPVAQPAPVPPVAVTPPVEPPRVQFVWGRWSSFAKGEGAPAMVALLDGQREILFANDIFGLLRNESVPTAIPSQGAFNFQLAGSEAYSLANGVVGPAQVTGGSFGVDFNQRTFNTALAVQHGGGLEQLSAQGKVQFQGLLLADTAKSNMNMSGALSGNGTEAAYLFDKQLSGGGLLGAVRWVR